VEISFVVSGVVLGMTTVVCRVAERTMQGRLWGGSEE
jgi:hypothetical protein